MIKGQEGEEFVIREVEKVANYLGKTVRCFNHVILDFDSVYGSRTAELDHIIICIGLKEKTAWKSNLRLTFLSRFLW